MKRLLVLMYILPLLKSLGFVLECKKMIAEASIECLLYHPRLATRWLYWKIPALQLVGSSTLLRLISRKKELLEANQIFFHVKK